MKKYRKKIIWISLTAVLAYFLVPGVIFPLYQKKVTDPQKILPPDVPGESAERVACIDDNDQALLRRLQVIASAEKEIIFSTFNLLPDAGGQDVIAALMDAANRGVRVRMIIDGMNADLDLKVDDIFRSLTAWPNIEVRVYNHFDVWKPWKLNYRLHDKYLVADDHVYILGGRNTRNVSLGSYQKNRDYDRDVLVFDPVQAESSSLQQVKAYFEQVWALPETKPVRLAEKPMEWVADDMHGRYQERCSQFPEITEPTDWREMTIPTQGICLLYNPIHPGSREPVLWNSLQQLMQGGKDIIIQTPYLVCSRTMYRDLEALTRQGTVKMITNSMESGANVFGSIDYLNQKKRIYRLGADVYEYAGDRSCHTKSVMIDEDISIVGSFNFDMRSAYLDTETMLVIRCPELNRQLRQTAQTYMDRSRHIDPDGTVTLGSNYEELAVPGGKKIMYHLGRLLAPLIRHLI